MAADAFLKVDGIDGESTDANHTNWIELTSFSAGMSQPVSTSSATGGRTAERVNIGDIVVTKTVDKASPTLAQACCDGRHISEVKIEVCEASGDKHTYLVYTMEDVIVSSVSVGGGGDKPSESVSFNFGKLKWEYTPIGNDGRPGSKVGPVGWNLEQNAKI